MKQGDQPEDDPRDEEERLLMRHGNHLHLSSAFSPPDPLPSSLVTLLELPDEDQKRQEPALVDSRTQQGGGDRRSDGLVLPGEHGYHRGTDAQEEIALGPVLK
jgi:hypothetical protein